MRAGSTRDTVQRGDVRSLPSYPEVPMTPPTTDLAAQVSALARCDAAATAQTLLQAVPEPRAPLAYAIHWAVTGTGAALHAWSYVLSTVDELAAHNVALAALLAREHNAAHMPEVAIHLAQTLTQIVAMGESSAAVVRPWVPPFVSRCLQQGGLSALAAVEHLAATAPLEQATLGLSAAAADELCGALRRYAQSMTDAQDRAFVMAVAESVPGWSTRGDTASVVAARHGLQDLLVASGLPPLGADELHALATCVGAAVSELDARDATAWSVRAFGRS